tara:strand:- start:248 stop:571 length:324 start_codon:yes stop_codon:yes gene_type:complete
MTELLNSKLINQSISSVREHSVPEGRLRRTSDADALKAVAEKFEAYFVQSMLKAARNSALSDDLLSNNASKTFTSLLDEKFADAAANTQDLGIADALYRQFKDHVSD